MWLGPAAVVAPRNAGGGPLIGRRPAQILARRELDKVSIWVRILHDIERLFNTSANAVPGGWFGLVVFGVLVAVLVIAIVTWARPSTGRRIRARSVLGGKARTAEDYRQAATRLAEAGDYSGAIVEAVRAIAAELEERGILPPRLGRTADELAVEAGRELPELAADLLTVTRLFDDVRYGDRRGTQAGYELACLTYGRVRTAPVTATDGNRTAAADLLVPR
jgi:Domain of unknown function (DUF4129)